jgi:16S rRNA (cytosine1402-N4)-methyltransferase
VTDGHVSVLLDEVLEALNIRPDGVYLDGTFGRGGHSRAILDRLGPNGRLLALDRDLDAVSVGAQWQDPRFAIAHAAFGELDVVARRHGIESVDGLLLDIGVSSPQIDTPQRGFSFRHDAPLDMRMDTSRGMSAAEWLNQAETDEIARVISDYGEERFAKSIARAVVAARGSQAITRTRQLAEIVASDVRTRERGQDPATRTFQAIRIHINHELEELEAALPLGVGLLKPGGRIAVISFHSLEDRIVKRFLRAEARGEELPAEIPVTADLLAQGRLRLIGKAIHPGAAETTRNPRARSAVLRVAERREAACSG